MSHHVVISDGTELVSQRTNNVVVRPSVLLNAAPEC